jgi:formate hydrogenlyase subunit 4
MPVVRLHEVGSVLALILLLLIAKHVPVVNTLPLTNITGIVCFTFAIFLSLRIFQVELARIRAEE